MDKEQRCYQAINAILAKHDRRPYDREEIKTAIGSSIREYDYITAIVAYLWGAYNRFDRNARIAFRDVFSDDLKEHDPTAFYFFSFYFSRDFKRTGFDRRQPGDRRQAYSIDHFANIMKDLRTGVERRKQAEMRTHWTRVSEWSSVPFETTQSGPGTAGSDDLLTEERGMLEPLSQTEAPPAADVTKLKKILSDLVRYYDTHIQQGQTEWMDFIDEEDFRRAQDVMRQLIATRYAPE